MREYATEADEQRDVADWIAEADVSGDSPEMLGVEDESAARLERMSQLRAQLDAAERAAHGGIIEPADQGGDVRACIESAGHRRDAAQNGMRSSPDRAGIIYHESLRL